jgi:hypothetical protein
MDRMPNLAEVDAQCTASLAVAPPKPRLVDENLRGYVLLLSAHFQGFCRDLYTECSQIVVAKVRPTLQLLFQDQFTAHRTLEHGNPTSRISGRTSSASASRSTSQLLTRRTRRVRLTLAS